MRKRRIAAIVMALLPFVLGGCPAQSQEPVPSPAAGNVTEASAPPAVHMQHYIENETFVPVMNALPQGLDVVEIYADTQGRHPLVVLTHGTSTDPAERLHVTPWAQFNQALWFARRGYVALVVVRKGYGRSGGKQDVQAGGCGPRGSFREAGEASTVDLEAVMHWAASRPEVDSATIVSAGVSTGGFAQVALSAEPPKGLKVAISFAGGRGSDGKEHNCDLDGVAHAFHSFGKDAAKHGGLPMLWIYAQNDHYFPPAMATKFDEAYRQGGGVDEFVMMAPDGEDGHHLYSHPDVWGGTVTAFLKSHALLPLGDQVLPPPSVQNVPAPAGLVNRGLEAWGRFLAGAPYKAFATTGGTEWGLATGVFDQAIADQEAKERCVKAAGANAHSCKVVARTPGVK